MDIKALLGLNGVPYHVNGSSKHHSKYMPSYLKSIGKYANSPTTVINRGELILPLKTGTGWMDEAFFHYDEVFWQGKSILDLGCGHTHGIKVLTDICGDNLNYVGLDKRPIQDADSFKADNITFHQETDMNDLTTDSFQQKFDIMMYLGVEVMNLEVTKEFLKPKSFLIYSCSDQCWDLETHKGIIEQGFKLKQQIWSLAQIKIPGRTDDKPREFESLSAEMIYQIN